MPYIIQGWLNNHVQEGISPFSPKDFFVKVNFVLVSPCGSIYSTGFGIRKTARTNQ